MSALDIPKTDVEGLSILREMPDASLGVLIANIEKSPTVTELPGVSPDDTKHAVDTLNTLYTIRAFNDVTTETFIEDICESLIESGDLKPNEEARLRERLSRLLEIELLKISAKAATLQTEHERLLCSARVLTDARPVYGASASDKPAAMIITHELKLTFHEGPRGTLQEIYIGLGPGELEELRSQLQRAEEKAKSLREALRPTQIIFFEPKTKH